MRLFCVLVFLAACSPHRSVPELAAAARATTDDRALRDLAPHIRAAAPLAARDLPAVIGLLAHRHRAVSDAAVAALVATGSSAIPALTDAARDPRPVPRELALHALIALRAVPALNDVARGRDASSIRRHATEALIRAGAGPATLAALLDDADVSVRNAALAGLYKLGPAAGPVAGKLIDLLVADPEAGAVPVLAAIGPAAVPALRARASDPATPPAARAAIERALAR